MFRIWSLEEKIVKLDRGEIAHCFRNCIQILDKKLDTD